MVANIGYNAPKTNRVKVLRYFWGLSSENINFDFEDKDRLGLESTQTPRGLK